MNQGLLNVVFVLLYGILGSSTFLLLKEEQVESAPVGEKKEPIVSIDKGN